MHQLNPKLVLLGGCALAFGASVINVTFLVEAGTSVSHLTGDLSRIASGLVDPAHDFAADMGRVTAATLCFVLGATASGFLIHRGRTPLRPDAVRHGHLADRCRGSPDQPTPSRLACGLQNALASRYLGMVLRTTHVTGILPDLGIALGMRLRLRGHSIAP
ncbi:MAG: DUF1275 domain-containing protein [Candidatus Synoicihabitans palmerolidicus]|nr:DUF1275 domain-containing protein [Candidatus Synoicihabitans palmerolidicus]